MRCFGMFVKQRGLGKIFRMIERFMLVCRRCAHGAVHAARHAQARERFKWNAARRFICPDCFEQSQHALLNEIFSIAARKKIGPRTGFYQAKIPNDHLFFRIAVSLLRQPAQVLIRNRFLSRRFFAIHHIVTHYTLSSKKCQRIFVYSSQQVSKFTFYFCAYFAVQSRKQVWSSAARHPTRPLSFHKL